MWSLVSGLFNLAKGSEDSSMLERVSVLHSFSWMDKSPLSIYTMFTYLFIYGWAFGLFPLAATFIKLMWGFLWWSSG